MVGEHGGWRWQWISDPFSGVGVRAPDETAERPTDSWNSDSMGWLNVLQEASGTQSVAATLQGMEGFEVGSTYLALLEREPAVQSLSRKKNLFEEYK